MLQVINKNHISIRKSYNYPFNAQGVYCFRWNLSKIPRFIPFEAHGNHQEALRVKGKNFHTFPQVTIESV